MEKLQRLAEQINIHFAGIIQDSIIKHNELTIEVAKQDIINTLQRLRDEADFQFTQLIDLCAVDYLDYGKDEWTTDKATANGFDRGVKQDEKITVHAWHKPRFAVVYHLLSMTHNFRLRVKTYLEHDDLIIDSAMNVWPAANWYEREAFDLYGILFSGHKDLRRILTDYGFMGHPFRKDFPLSGYVEPRYDAKQARVVYEKVEITPRVLVPKVIREDSRYAHPTDKERGA